MPELGGKLCILGTCDFGPNWKDAHCFPGVLLEFLGGLQPHAALAADISLWELFSFLCSSSFLFFLFWLYLVPDLNVCSCQPVSSSSIAQWQSSNSLWR